MSSNPWVIHVKEWSKANNVSYGCAISKPECKEAYQKKKNKTNREIAKKPASIRQAFPKSKTTAVSKEAPKVSNKKVSKAQIDKMAKEIEDLREKAGKIAETKGRVTKEVSKMLEKVTTMTREKIRLVKLFKQQQKT
jgi:hypothetical protein